MMNKKAFKHIKIGDIISTLNIVDNSIIGDIYTVKSINNGVLSLYSSNNSITVTYKDCDIHFRKVNDIISEYNRIINICNFYALEKSIYTRKPDNINVGNILSSVSYTFEKEVNEFFVTGHIFKILSKNDNMYTIQFIPSGKIQNITYDDIIKNNSIHIIDSYADDLKHILKAEECTCYFCYSDISKDDLLNNGFTFDANMPVCYMSYQGMSAKVTFQINRFGNVGLDSICINNANKDILVNLYKIFKIDVIDEKNYKEFYFKSFMIPHIGIINDQYEKIVKQNCKDITKFII